MINEDSGEVHLAVPVPAAAAAARGPAPVTEFSQPGFIAPPHFMPHIDAGLQRVRQVRQGVTLKAVEVKGEGDGKRVEQKTERCMSYSLCAVACPENVVTMREVADYREPPAHIPRPTWRATATTTFNTYKVWSSRRRA